MCIEYGIWYGVDEERNMSGFEQAALFMADWDYGQVWSDLQRPKPGPERWVFYCFIFRASCRSMEVQLLSRAL